MPYAPCSAVAKVEVTTAPPPPPPPPPPAKMGVVYGWVRDERTGEPIPSATVTVNGYATTTDSRGYYEVEVDAGTYTVTAKKFGYREARKSINVSTGRRVECNFYLAPILVIPSWWWYVVALGVVSFGVVAVTVWRKRTERARAGIVM